MPIDAKIRKVWFSTTAQSERRPVLPSETASPSIPFVSDSIHDARGWERGTTAEGIDLGMLTEVVA